MDVVQFLVGGLVVMALINAVSLVWAFYLDHKLRNRPVPKNYDVHVEGTKVFSDTDLTQVEQMAEQQFATVVQESATRLQQSLNGSIDQLSAKITSSAETTANSELEKYKVTLETLQTQSVQEFSKLQEELNTKRTELITALEQQIAGEREKRIDDFNARLGDVMSSYLAESLGNNVDLGAQSVYIIQMLETHKEDIKRDVLSL